MHLPASQTIILLLAASLLSAYGDEESSSESEITYNSFI
jgi:hypothetical protein